MPSLSSLEGDSALVRDAHRAGLVSSVAARLTGAKILSQATPEAKFNREHETPAGQPPRRRRYKSCTASTPDPG